jgi:hypothetical protein
MDRRSAHALSSQHFWRESSMRNPAALAGICGKTPVNVRGDA